MDNRRSYLDSLNSGRVRRSQTSLDQLNRSLEQLEAQLKVREEPVDTYRQSRRRLADETARFGGASARNLATAATSGDAAYGRSNPQQTQIAEEIESLRNEMRAQLASARRDTVSKDTERSLAADSHVGRIADEMAALRSELRSQLDEAVREASFRTAARSNEMGSTGFAEIKTEIERLTSAMSDLSQRSDDRPLNVLRLELEQARAAIDSLAREDSLRSIGDRWEDFERRMDRFQENLAADLRHRPVDPAMDGLVERIDYMSRALQGLPESLPLGSIEDKIRTLSMAVEKFAQRQDQPSPKSLAAIEDRLDEISRAIVASAASPAASHSDEQLRRIETRIASLSKQLDAEKSVGLNDQALLDAMDRRFGELAARIDVVRPETGPDEAEVLHTIEQRFADLAARIDAARSVAAPDDKQLLRTMERKFGDLEARIDSLGARHPGEVAGANPDILAAMDERFGELARRIEDAKRDAARRNPAEESGILDAIEQRFDDLSIRLDASRDQAASAVGAFDDREILSALDERFGELARRLEAARTSDEAILGLESRLDAIVLKIQQQRTESSVDPELIGSLEAQIASLSRFLAQPPQQANGVAELAPRLDRLEKSLVGNRDLMVEAAREAAERAVRNIPVDARADFDAVSGLADDLKQLESLTRRSDERNSKTFGAIHDTLLKIVDRLGTLETVGPKSRSSEEPVVQPKISVGQAPSIVPEDDLPRPQAFGARPSITPAEAAIAAAEAALVDPVDDATVRKQEKSVFGGLTRAFTRKDRNDDLPDLPGMELAPPADEMNIDLHEPLDQRAANRPLEPGSGAPDLSAIMKRVRDDRARPDKQGADAATSDFLAAARRAAQAAAAEAEILKVNAGASKGASKSSFGEMIKAHRKPILLAVAAVGIVLLGLQMSKAYFNDPAEIVITEQAAPASDQPAVEPASEADAAPAEGDAVRQAEASVSPPEQLEADPEAEEPPVVVEGESAESPELQAMAPEAGADAGPAEEPSEPIAEATEPTENLAAEPAAAAKLDVPVDAGPIPLREAAANGDSKALFEVGARYADGRGTKADLKQAAIWYEKSAELGFAPAQYRIGNMLEKGNGIDRDIEKAKTWYQLAANQGNASAMHNLAVLFAMGADGTADNDSAVRWFTQAADLGVKDSQFNLGILAAKGVGMPKNLEESYKWFALVAKTGDKDSAAKRDQIANSLRPEQLERARATVELWKPTEMKPEANSVEIPESWQESPGTTAGVDMKKAIRNVQAILNKNGYDAGAPDGLMGDRTKDAIKAFQKDNGLDPNGAVDKALVEKLLAKK